MNRNIFLIALFSICFFFGCQKENLDQLVTPQVIEKTEIATTSTESHQGSSDVATSRGGTPNFDIIYNGPVCLGDIVKFTVLPLPASQDLTVVEWEVLSGGLQIMSTFGLHALAEAASSGSSFICATVVNECNIEKRICTRVTVNKHTDCTGEGQIPNPK